MIYNYIKSKKDLPMTKIYNILKPEDKLKFNTINTLSKTTSKFKPKEEINNNSKNNSSRVSLKTSELQRFRQLQKKYGKIYEKKRNESISFEDKIKNYINQKTIDSTSSNNTDKDILRKNIIFKRVRKNNKDIKKMNKTEEKGNNYNTSSNDIINKNSNIKYIKEYKNKPILKQKRMNSQSSYKSIKSLSDNKNIYKIYIIKNIVSSDKRIFVNINYINLSNNEEKRDKKFYSNNMLEISDINEINYIGNNCIKNNNAKHKKKLSKIEEEIDDKINSNLSLSIKENNNNKNTTKKKQEKKEEANPKSMKRIINNNRINNNLTAKFRKKYLYYKNLNKPDKNE